MQYLIFSHKYSTHNSSHMISFLQPLAGGVHPRCTAAASLGSAIAGLAAGLLRLLTKAVFPETSEGMRLSSSVFFAMAVAVLVVCFFAHYCTKKYKQQLTMAFFQAEYAESTGSVLLQSESVKNSIQVELGGMEEGEEIIECPKEDEKEDEDEDEDELGESIVFEDNDVQVQVQETETSSKGKLCHLFSVFVEGSRVYREAFRCAWLPITAQFVNFIITLNLFPGVGK